MTAFRFLAGLLFLAAVILFIHDRSRPLPVGAPRHAMSLAQHWSELSPNSMAASRVSVQTRLHPALWDPVITGLLGLPAWMSAAGLGAAFGLLGRRRRQVRLYTN